MEAIVWDGPMRRCFSVGDTVASVCAVMGLRKGAWLFRDNKLRTLEKQCFSGEDQLESGFFLVNYDPILQKQLQFQDTVRAKVAERNNGRGRSI